ncbi:MAG: ribosome-associated translation inhibitor RaiA [Deltaproteobacteria bacterium]|nr:ribosome-associated translation inhibitor RaiA [Deltaproteobacteria bacterium]
MEISITYRHVEPNETLKEYIEEKVSRIKKYLSQPMKADVIISLEKRRFIAEVNLAGDKTVFNSKEVSQENFFEAIDLVIDKLMTQVNRYKTKRIKKKVSPDLTIRHDIISVETSEENQPKVIQTENYFVKPMTIEEAIMQMNLLKNDFLVFIEAQSKRVNVLYQRRDGNYGLIETKGYGE